MKAIFSFLMVAVFLIAVTAHAGGTAPGKIIVKFKDSTTEEERTKVKAIHKLTNKDGKQQMANTEVLTIEDGRDPEDVARTLALDKAIEYAEPVQIRKPQAMPNDSLFGTQWYLKKIKMPEAWDTINLTAPTALIRVAVIDSGLVLNNPDINYSRVIWGCDWTRSPCQKPVDDTLTWSHGTGLAGVITAVQNNNIAIAGISNKIQLLVEKVCREGVCPTDAIANGITRAANSGAKIINLSLGGYTYSAAEAYALQGAYSKGILIVCASGNEGKYNVVYPYYPAILPECMTVGSTDYNDKIVNLGEDPSSYWGSNFGNNISVMAPGIAIFSLNNSSGTSVVNWSGTSFSAAQVSAVAAELFIKCPAASRARVRRIIEDSAAPLGADYLYGNGRIDADRAVDSPCEQGGMRPGKIYCFRPQTVC